MYDKIHYNKNNNNNNKKDMEVTLFLLRDYNEDQMVYWLGTYLQTKLSLVTFHFLEAWL